MRVSVKNDINNIYVHLYFATTMGPMDQLYEIFSSSPII